MNIDICVVGTSVNSLYKFPKLKQNFQKNEVVTGKTPFFGIGPFCTPNSICLNIGFWQSSFVWKFCVLNLSIFSILLKSGTRVFRKGFAFFRKFISKLKVFIENVQYWQGLSHKNITIFQTKCYFKNP